jgi:hypothetical protein
MTVAERLAILVVITFCGAILFWCAATAKAEDTYHTWTDSAGTVWFVDSEKRVPDAYADDAEEFEHQPYTAYDYFTPIDAVYEYDPDYPPVYLDDELKIPVDMEFVWPEVTIPEPRRDKRHRSHRNPR